MGCCCSQLERIVAERFDEADIVMKNVGWANLRASTQQSCCKRKGNGALVLTKEKLWFRFICCGDEEIEIPLSAITKVSLSTSVRVSVVYVSTLSPMLVIEYTSGLVAFSVPQSDNWRQQIEETTSQSKSQDAFKETRAYGLL